MLYFDKGLIANKAKPHGKWWGEVRNARRHADAVEKHVMASNSAAIIPRDVWQEMDTVTKELMRGDGGRTYMEDLMPLAKAVNIGKMVVIKRSASDAGQIIRSISGQVGTPTDKTIYKYDHSIVPITSTSYHRNFRELEALRSENFDALIDDQRNSLWNLNRANADYVLRGDPSQVVDGHQGYGIIGHPNAKAINLGTAAGGAGIDLTTATSDQVIAFINGPFAKMLDDNFILDQVNIYVSAEVMRNLEKPLSSADGFKGGSLRAFIEENTRINRIKRTFELTGNAFFSFVPRAEFIRPIIGMATSTVALPRQHPRANYVFDIWNAMGLEVVADYQGRSGVFYSTVVN